MKIPDILKNKKARDDLREKFEVIMAVVVISGYLYKKYQKSQEDYIDITSFEQEK